MIKAKETISKSISIKGAYMDGNHFLDEDGSEINICELLNRTYGDGVQFDVKVTTKVDNDLG